MRSATLIPQDNQRDVLIYAFRYALGRSTYSTHTMQQVLRYAWVNLSTADRQLIKKEIREAEKSGYLGMEMDAVGWLEILGLED